MIDVNGAQIGTDPEGYLENLADWTEDVARVLAAQDKLELSADHWRVIAYIRDYFDAQGSAPSLRFLQRGLADEYGGDWGDKKFLFGLFPYGPAKQAGRYAGTPKPTGCV